MKRVMIIAEVGPNHNGRLDLAHKYINELSSLDIDAIKFQLGSPEAVYSRDAFKPAYQRGENKSESALEMTKGHQLKRVDHRELFEACNRNGIEYMCSAFDLESLRYLHSEFRLRHFKIASGELLTMDMLEYIANHELPIILSTGMATDEEIESSIAVLESQGSKDITLLYCVSDYPAPIDQIDLGVMTRLRDRFGHPVGFSDHTTDNLCAVTAAALGATVLEKHVTLDQTMKGPDHKASASLQEFFDLVESIRKVENLIGDGQRTFSPKEREIRSSSRKSIVTTRDLNESEKIRREDICFKRPGTGISPMRSHEIVGQVTTRAIERDRVLKIDDVKEQGHKS